VANSVISAAIVALSAMAVLVLLSALRKARARGEWSGTATLGAVIVLLTISFVEMFVTYFGLWTKQRNAYKNVTWVVPDVAHQVMRLLAMVLAVIAAVVFVVRLRRGRTVVNIPAVLFLLIEIVSAESALLHGDNPFRPLSIVFLAVVLACTVAPRGLGIQLGVGTACMIAAIASGFTFYIHKDFSVFACTSDSLTSDKCGLFNFDFRGILENENALAMYLALAMPFVYIGFGSWEGTALAGYILILVMMTGGRSGMIAAAVTFLALILFRPNIRKPAAAPIRNTLLYIGLAAAVVVGFVLPFVTEDPNAYHGRAGLWILVRDALSDHATLLYGTGMLGWQHVRDSGLIDPTASYSVHNEWLQVLYSAGLIGLLLFVAALAVLVWQARPNYSLVIGCVLVPVFMLGVTERPWPIDTSDWLTWAIPAALLSYPVVRRRSDEGDTRSPRREDLVLVETVVGSTSRADADVVRWQ
jgi:O-Antigen ligase